MSTSNGTSIASVIRDAVQRARREGPAAISDALLAVPASEIGTFLHATFDESAERVLLTSALGASPGAAAFGAQPANMASAIMVAETASFICPVSLFHMPLERPF